jgi:phosphatidylserine decarboxylase
VPIDSPQFGRVMAVCIGAMMVASIKTTVSEGDFVKRGQEFGYFAFGAYIFLYMEMMTPFIEPSLGW